MLFIRLSLAEKCPLTRRPLIADELDEHFMHELFQS